MALNGSDDGRRHHVQPEDAIQLIRGHFGLEAFPRPLLRTALDGFPQRVELSSSLPQGDPLRLIHTATYILDGHNLGIRQESLVVFFFAHPDLGLGRAECRKAGQNQNYEQGVERTRTRHSHGFAPPDSQDAAAWLPNVQLRTTTSRTLTRSGPGPEPWRNHRERNRNAVSARRYSKSKARNFQPSGRVRRFVPGFQEVLSDSFRLRDQKCENVEHTSVNP